MKYREIDDLTSDVLFEAYGKDLKELFENCAEALFSLMCQMEKVEAKEKDLIQVEGNDAEDLLFNWLNRLIAQVDAEEKFYSKFEIYDINEKKLKARISGEGIRPELGSIVVKSVTFYKFKVEKTEKGWKAMFSVDI